MAAKVIQEKSTFLHTIANNIIKGVLANQHKHVGTALRIADMGMALDKILQLTDNFTRKFRAELLFCYHQQVAGGAQTSTIDLTAIAPLKNQFYARITQRLTQQIIAIAKGQIINPGIDMAMNEHLQNIADLVKQNALQPAPPEHFAASTEHQPEACSSETTTPTLVSAKSTAAPSGFGKHVMDKRNDARDAALKQAFGMTLTKEPAPATNPAEPHPPYLLERHFQRFGFQDAKGKYQSYVPLPGLGTVEQPLITFAPNPVSFGFAPGIGDMTAGNTVLRLNFLEGSHHQQDIERILPSPLAISPHQKTDNDLPTKKVKLFDIRKTDTNRHRFFSRDNANPDRDRPFPGGRTAKEIFLSHAAASIKQHPPEPPLPEQPSCSTSGYTIAALQGGYDAMDQMGLIPHDPSTSAGKKQAIKTGYKFFNVKDDREEHAGAQKFGFWLFGAVHGLYEHYKACNP